MTSNRRRRLARLMPCALLAGLSAAQADEPAGAPDAVHERAARLGAGDWLVRARVASLFPIDETSTVGLIGGRIETPDMVIPDVEIAYFATDHVSFSGQAGALRTRPRIVGSMVGSFDIGTIWSAAAAASVQYHFLPEARINPYAGIGVSYSRPISTDPAIGVDDFDLRSQTSLMLQVGADYHIAGDWFANAAAKYLIVPEQVYQSRGASFHDDLDMAFAGVGIGYRF